MRRAILQVTILSAAFFAVAAISTGAQAASHGRYCLTHALGGAKNCSFRSMVACLRSKLSNADDCSRDSGTTGSGHRFRTYG